MPKDSIDTYRPRGILIGEIFYSDKDLDAIVAAVGKLPKGKVEHWQPDATAASFERVMLDRRTALSRKLESAALWWHVQRDDQGRPTPVQIASRMELIERRATALLKALGAPDGVLEQMPDALRFGQLQAFAAMDKEEYPGQPAGERLRAAVVGVHRLHRWAGSARNRNRAQKPTPRTRRHSGDAALDDLFRSLVSIYMEIFRRVPGTSTAKPGGRNEGEPTGPFIRYMRAGLRPLLGDRTPSNTAIRQRWRRLHKSS